LEVGVHILIENQNKLFVIGTNFLIIVVIIFIIVFEELYQELNNANLISKSDKLNLFEKYTETKREHINLSPGFKLSYRLYV